jgi:branched-chain amino acid transport system substrate-binding protein
VAVADTTSTPTGGQTAAQDLVQVQGVFEVAEASNLFVLAAPYLQKAGIPVVGPGTDGPEWCDKSYTNMFDFWGPSCSIPPAKYDTLATFFNGLGVKSVSFATVNVPSAIQAQNTYISGLPSFGIKTCNDYALPLGGVNFTAYALGVKQAGCQAAACICLLSSFLAMTTALKTAGVNVPVYFVGTPVQAILANKANEQAADGAYFLPHYPVSQNAALVADLEKWDPTYKGGNLPDDGASFAWMAANAVIESLQVAGQNPTRQSVITNLRQVTSWNDEGLASPPINFSTLGVAPATNCQPFVKFENGQFVPYPANGAPICGKKIP